MYRLVMEERGVCGGKARTLHFLPRGSSFGSGQPAFAPSLLVLRHVEVLRCQGSSGMGRQVMSIARPLFVSELVYDLLSLVITVIFICCLWISHVSFLLLRAAFAL